MPRRRKPEAASPPSERPENRRKPTVAAHATGIVPLRGEPCGRCGLTEALRHPDGSVQCAGCGTITATT